MERQRGLRAPFSFAPFQCGVSGVMWFFPLPLRERVAEGRERGIVSNHRGIAPHPPFGHLLPARGEKEMHQRQSISPRTTLHTRPPDQTSPFASTVSSMIASWPTSRPWLMR